MFNTIPISINEEGRFTYVNQEKEKTCGAVAKTKNHSWGPDNKCISCGRWGQWKKWTEMSEEEQNIVNLGQYHQKYILLDFDYKNLSEGQIMDKYHEWERKYVGSGQHIHYFSELSPHGFHIYLPFTNLAKLEPEVQHEFRKEYVKKFGADEAKISMNGVVSLPSRPHFKTLTIGKILNANNPTVTGESADTLNIGAINQMRARVRENKERIQLANKDMNFEKFFEEDPFFKYISTNIIPDGSGRGVTLFTNLAIACVKSGKSKDEIDVIMKPIILNNFPGKIYQEFEGWLKKAFDGRIETYNKYQLNNWSKEFSTNKKEIYDTKPGVVTSEEVQQLEKIKKETKHRFMTDEELENVQEEDISWLIDKWLARGDINFIAGKAASYKTTSVLHMAYCVATGRKVFNEYDTMESPVLYLNEENSTPIFKKLIRRIKKGMDITTPVPNMHHSILESWKLDQAEECNILIDYINTHKIKLLVCDSFRRFFDFEENSATDINRLFNNLKFIRETCPNLTIIILHHVKKSQYGTSGDVRDSLRGSSDIVNSADSIIGVDRKRNCESFTISHIKNRAGQEMSNRLIMIDSGEEDDKAYLYQSDAVLRDMEHRKSVPEKMADDILKHLETNNIQDFKRTDLKIFEEQSSSATVARALKTLLEEGTLSGGGRGQSAVYFLNSNENTPPVIPPDENSEPENNKNSSSENNNSQKTL